MNVTPGYTMIMMINMVEVIGIHIAMRIIPNDIIYC
jgi:hypothetical protein